MSRSGYSEDYDEDWRQIMWRGAVASAIRGKRGQAFLREMVVAFLTWMADESPSEMHAETLRELADEARQGVPVHGR